MTSPDPIIACLTCDRKLYKASGSVRCLAWKRHTMIIQCSEYVGPHKDCHVKLVWGPDYSDTLAHSRSK
jgi:hypothetical protein